MRLFTFALVFSLLGLPAIAKDTGTDDSKTILKHVEHFVVQRDGSYTLTAEHAVRIDHERAIASTAQFKYSFNATLETVDILEAYTEKPDGRRLPLGPDQIKVQQEAAYDGAPMFQDMKVKVLIFADVQVGDVLYTKRRKTRRSATFEGYFSDDTYPYFNPTKQLTLIYDMPADMPLQVYADGFAATAPRTDNGRKVYQWDYVPSENARVESGTVSYSDFGKRLEVSTFPDFASVGLAYDKLARPAAVLTPAIQAKVDELTKSATTPREKAMAINDWVRKNIRYVAVYLGNGGVVPHSAETVMRNLYGDCKDHATLMETMLQAAGIDSTPVLINHGNSYTLSSNASLGQFNHAITYIPSLDLYLDSTASNVEGGFLPFFELDKPVIHTRTGKLGRTPVSQEAAIRISYNVEIARDGSAHFKFTRDNSGTLAEQVRFEHRNWKKPDQERFVTLILNTYKMNGEGSVELGELLGRAPHYAYTLKGKAENWLYLPGTVGMPAASSLWSGMTEHVFAMETEKIRTQPFNCSVNDVIEDAVYQFPEGSKVLHMPKDVTIDSPFIRFQARYTQQGRQLKIHRLLDTGKKDSKVCSPADYAAMKDDIQKIVRDLRSQVILQAQ